MTQPQVVILKEDIYTADSGDNGDMSALSTAAYVVDENVRDIRGPALLICNDDKELPALRSLEPMHGLLIYTSLFPLVARKCLG
jgi:hypothetical protein